MYRHTHTLLSDAVLPNLIWRSPAKSTHVKVKGGSCDTLNSGRGGGGGSNERSPFEQFASNTVVKALLHECSSLDDPELRFNFGECFFNSVVKNSRVGTCYDQYGKVVLPWQQDRVFHPIG